MSKHDVSEDVFEDLDKADVLTEKLILRAFEISKRMADTGRHCNPQLVLEILNNFQANRASLATEMAVAELTKEEAVKGKLFKTSQDGIFLVLLALCGLVIFDIFL